MYVRTYMYDKVLEGFFIFYWFATSLKKGEFRFGRDVTLHKRE